MNKDEYVQRVLFDSLEDKNKEVVKPEVAIQLLSYDLHADHYPLLRKIAENPPSQLAKKEALRNLASDPKSAELLLKTFNDKSEDNEIRHICAVGLQNVNPEALQEEIKYVLMDDSEDDELKAALLNTINYAPNTEIIDNDYVFQVDLKKQSKSKEFKKSYKQYQQGKSLKQ